jgi:hypothetical protein
LGCGQTIAILKVMSVSKSHEGLPGLVAISLLVNVILVFVILGLFSKGRAQRISSNIPIVVTATNFVTAVLPETSATNEPAVSPLKFDWSRIESEDWRAYVANLRRIGCPERTIRDIVLPQIADYYEDKRFQLTVERDFWMNGPERFAAEQERDKKLEALDAEHTALVKELVGLDWVDPEDNNQDRMRYDFMAIYMIAPTLSIEDSKRLGYVVKKYETLGRKIRYEASLSVDRAASAKTLLNQFSQEISSFLPNGEFAELSLRLAMLEKHSMAEDLTKAGISLSGEELRRIVQIRTAHENILGEVLNFGIVNVDGDEKSPLMARAHQKEADGKIRVLLGDARYFKYKAVTDDGFKSALAFAEARKLPAETGRIIYDIQDAAKDRAVEAWDDTSLTPTERRRALQDLQQATIGAFEELLGGEATEAFKTQNSGWFHNLWANRQ